MLLSTLACPVRRCDVVYMIEICLDAPTVTLIGEAVFARCLSGLKQERIRASKRIAGPQKEPFKGDKKQFINDLEQALYASKIISYTQGFMLMRETAKEVGFH